MDVFRIGLLCYDLSSNALGRAHILAQACQPFADVTIWGPVLGDGVWAPLAEQQPTRTLRLRRRPSLAEDLRSAADMMARTCDVVYASKPLTTSYGLARVVRKRHGRPVVLDIDDWELGFLTVGGVRWKILADGIRRWRQPNSYFPTARLDRLAREEPLKTVSNRFLQQRFGGLLVPHGRDAALWDPKSQDMARAKARFGLQGRRVVLFFGSPRSHKGLDVLVEAVAQLPDADLMCAIVGADAQDPQARRLVERDPARVVLIPQQPFSMAPSIVAMADVVAIPQRHNVGTLGQTPAKVFDAMALGKPVVSTRVGDIPEILTDCGVIVDPDSVQALRAGLERLLGDPGMAARLGRRARQRFLKQYTIEAMTTTLRPVFEDALSASRTS